MRRDMQFLRETTMTISTTIEWLYDIYEAYAYDTFIVMC